MSEPTKRALLIGIDEYDIERWRLYGCENDSRAIQSVLIDPFGFPPDNITMVLNDEATRERILREFEKLIDATRPGDIVVTHYAGHGSYMTDLEGDEADGKDETIVTHDSHHSGDKPNLDINDDEIHNLLLRLAEKTDYVTMIFDCCHSGTMTRDVSGEEARSVEGDTRSGPEMGREPIDPAGRSTGATTRGPSGWLPLSDKYVLIAGCRDEEKSYEKRVTVGEETIKHGSLTYHLCEQLRGATPGTTYRDVFEATAAGVTAHNGRQHPQMEGAVDREIFGVRDIEPMRFIRVTNRDGRTVRLAGGAIHGITVGSKWGAYPARAKTADPGTKIGTIEIRSVGPATTEATILDETGEGAIDDTARAVVEEHNYGDLRLTYALKADPSLREEVEVLRAALGEKAQLREAEGDEPADVTLYLIAPRESAGARDPAPQLGAISEPTWAAIGTDGLLAMPTKALGEWAGDEKGHGGLPHNLCLLAGAMRALELDNPDPNSALKGKVSLELLRGAPTEDGVSWSVAKPESAGGQIVYESGGTDADGKPVYGDFIAFRITNGHAERVYVTLLNIDSAGAVSVVYPPRGAEGPVEPGQTFDYGNRDTDKPRDLVVPKSYPFYRIDEDAPIEGTETFKLIITPEHADFRYMEQAAMRSVDGAPATKAVTRLWRNAADPSRGLREEEEEVETVKVSENDWATVTRAVTLRRAARLRPDGSELRLRGASLSLPRIEGEARIHDWRSEKLASVVAASPSIAAAFGKLGPALERSGMERRRTVEIEGRRKEAPSRSLEGAEASPAGIVSVPTPGAGMGQALLVTDENGLVRWQYATGAEGGRSLDGERGLTQEFVLDEYVLADSGAIVDTEAEGDGRGVVGEIGKRLFNVVVFPLIEEGVGELGEMFVAKWEAAKRPYRVRRFTPDDYRSPDAVPLDAEGWRAMASGRALMLVHGTFSRAHAAFGGMPKAQVEELYRAYDGRVFAFDHWTMAHDPLQNIRHLLDPGPGGGLTPIPEGTELDLDIICHSRGGLVSRVLSEMQSELALGSRKINVGRVVFVGSPNGGTAFASKEHIKKLLDRMTNLFTLVAQADQSGTVETLEAVFAAVKTLAVGVFGGLDGIQCMAPGSEFMRRLDGHGPQGTRYFALASNYAADPSTARRRFIDHAVDRLLFGQRGNDLVVPTDSVFDRRSGLGKPPAEERRGNGASDGSGFPISERVIYEGGVDHSGYFATPRSHEKIMEWLSS